MAVDEDPEVLQTTENLAGIAGNGEAAMATRQVIERGVVTHRNAGFVSLYDGTGNLHRVARQNMGQCLQNGLSVRCPLCHGFHQEDGPNACPSKPKLLRMVCPVCSLHGRETDVWEDPVLAYSAEASDAKPRDASYVAPRLPDRASREVALQRRLEQHMLAYHKSETEAMYGLKEEPEKG